MHPNILFRLLKDPGYAPSRVPRGPLRCPRDEDFENGEMQRWKHSRSSVFLTEYHFSVEHQIKYLRLIQLAHLAFIRCKNL